MDKVKLNYKESLFKITVCILSSPLKIIFFSVVQGFFKNHEASSAADLKKALRISLWIFFKSKNIGYARENLKKEN